MAQQLTPEERLAILEHKVAYLEQDKLETDLFKQDQESRDLALLARIDSFISDLRRIERVQMRSFDMLTAGQRNQDVRITALEGSVTALNDAVRDNTKAITVLADVVKDHKQGIESLAAQVNDIAIVQQRQQVAIDLLIAGQQRQQEAIDTLIVGQLKQQESIDTLTVGQFKQQEAIAMLITGQQRQQESIDMLTAGQQQIIALLTGGKPPRND